MIFVLLIRIFFYVWGFEFVCVFIMLCHYMLVYGTNVEKMVGEAIMNILVTIVMTIRVGSVILFSSLITNRIISICKTPVRKKPILIDKNLHMI